MSFKALIIILDQWFLTFSNDGTLEMLFDFPETPYHRRKNKISQCTQWCCLKCYLRIVKKYFIRIIIYIKIICILENK